MTQSRSLRDTARSFYVNTLLKSNPIWKYGLNTRRSLEFARNAPVLGSEAQRVVSDLNRDGVAKTSIEALTGDPNLLGLLQAESKRLEQERAEELERRAKKLAETDDLGNGYEKLFVVTMLNHDRPVIDPDGLLARFTLNSQLKGVADHYYGIRSRVADINIWRNLPTHHAPVASQLWHRDEPDDHLILKMFVYLEDVVPGAGPFSYVKGTHGKGDRDWGPEKNFDGMNWRATDEAMEAVAEADRRPSFPAPAGTVLFADTLGWHRGGNAVTDSRLVIQALFASDATLPGRLLGAPENLDRKSISRDLAYDLSKVA